MASQRSAVGEQRLFCRSLEGSRGWTSLHGRCTRRASGGATSHTSEGRGCGKWLQLGGEWPGALLARKTRTIRMCSLDARSEGKSACSPLRQKGENRKALAWANRMSREIDCEAIGGRAGEKYLPIGWAGEKAVRSGRPFSLPLRRRRHHCCLVISESFDRWRTLLCLSPLC